MSPFEVVQAIQSACVGVVGLDSRPTVVVLRSIDDQDVSEMAVIRFRCVSQRIEKFGECHEGKVKRHPMTSATVARVRIDDEHTGPVYTFLLLGGRPPPSISSSPRASGSSSSESIRSGYMSSSDVSI